MRHIVYLSAFLLVPFLFAAQFQSGDRIDLTEPTLDDIYMAGGELNVNAPVHGDCIAAGGKVNINDSIAADLVVGGGEVMIRDVIGDDVRVAGGSITIDSEVLDDVIVFGGDVHLTNNAIVHGNVVSYGGKLRMDGTVLGAMKASGGDISISGSVHGSASLASGSLNIRDGAKFFSEVNYWSESGQVDFGSSMQNGEATYDSSMAWEGKDYADEGVLLGFGIFFMMMFILGGFLVILLLEWAFGTHLGQAAKQVIQGWPKSLGIGVLYIIGVPVLIILSFVIVIGIPAGLFGLFIYGFSLLFGKFVAALVLTHIWKAKKSKSWGVFASSLIALFIATGLQIITSIPLLGGFISFCLLCITYGAILLAIRSKNSGSTSSPLGATVSDLG